MCDDTVEINNYKIIGDLPVRAEATLSTMPPIVFQLTAWPSWWFRFTTRLFFGARWIRR